MSERRRDAEGAKGARYEGDGKGAAPVRVRWIAQRVPSRFAGHDVSCPYEKRTVASEAAGGYIEERSFGCDPRAPTPREEKKRGTLRSLPSSGQVG